MSSFFPPPLGLKYFPLMLSRIAQLARTSMLLAAPVTIVCAQQAPSEPPPASTAASPAAQSESIIISSGDLLDVRVFNVLELSSVARVNGNGEILLPVTGTVKVGGLTPDQVAVEIEKTIKDRQIMPDPRVTVMVTEYSTQMVTVTGEVKNPGVYSLIGRHDLYYVLSAAGGPTANQGSLIMITRKDDPSHPESLPVNSPNYSSLEQTTMIHPGDTVVVSRAPMFYVVGDVGKSGAFYIQNGQTVNVLNALALAQSPNFTAATNRVALIRKTDNKTDIIPINVKEISQAKLPDPALQDGDILFVPGSTWKRLAQSAFPAVAGGLINTGASVGIVH